MIRNAISMLILIFKKLFEFLQRNFHYGNE